MTDDEGFLRRWARLKQRDPAAAGSSAELPRDEQVPAVSSQEHEPGAPAVAKKDEESVDLSKLPSIESLTKDSDYSVFMGKGVPDDLRRQALRRLYVTNPELAGPDLLEMNAFDYTSTEGIRPLVNPGLSAAVVLMKAAIGSTEAAKQQPEPAAGAPSSDAAESAAKPDEPSPATPPDEPKRR